MQIKQQKELTAKQKFRIMHLWNAEYPLNIAYSDISDFDNFLDGITQKKHFVMTNSSDEILGWIIVFNRDNARWFSIIVDSKVQGQGFGIKLLEKAKLTENKLFGWVVDHNRYKKQNGEAYQSPLKFYIKNGFKVCENERFNSDKLSCVKIEWVNQNC